MAEHRKKKRSSKNIIIGVVVIFAIIAISAVFFSLTNAPEPSRAESAILATVNGVPITQSDIDSLYNRLPPEQQLPGAKTQLLNQSIQELLLLDLAKKEGITVDDVTVDTQFNNLLDRNLVTEQQLAESLAPRNVTVADIKHDFRNQLIVFTLINKTIISGIAIEPAEISAFYEQSGLGERNITLTNETSAQIRAYLLNQKIGDGVALLVRQLTGQANIVVVKNPE